MIYGALPDRGEWRAADRIKKIDPNIRKLMAFLFKQRLNDHLNGNLRTIFNGGKIRIDLTNTKYKLMRECALEMKWKVITAKKRAEGDAGDQKTTTVAKKDPSQKHMT